MVFFSSQDSLADIPTVSFGMVEKIGLPRENHEQNHKPSHNRFSLNKIHHVLSVII